MITIAKKKIGVLTGGGDCPGLNNAIKHVALEAIKRGYIIEGLTEGWKGPIMAALKKQSVETVTYPLDEIIVRRIDRQGGTILMSGRENPFHYNGKDVSDEVIKFLDRRYHGVIAIGGEDTNGVAGKLAKKGLQVVAIPKTIDKDLCGTDTTLGFDSALAIDREILERLRSTAGSHGMVYFVELMGRRAGHLAYRAASADDTHFLTIPESEVDVDNLFNKIVKRRESLKMKRGYTRDGRRYAIVAAAEGTRLKGIGETRPGKIDDHDNEYVGGVAERLAKMFKDKTGYDARVNVPGHVQRAGPPTHDDRDLGIFFGTHAVEMIEKGLFGRMVSLQGINVTDVSLDVVIDRMRILDVQKCYDPENFKPIRRGSLYSEVEVPKAGKK